MQPGHGRDDDHIDDHRAERLADVAQHVVVHDRDQAHQRADQDQHPQQHLGEQDGGLGQQLEQ